MQTTVMRYYGKLYWGRYKDLIDNAYLTFNKKPCTEEFENLRNLKEYSYYKNHMKFFIYVEYQVHPLTESRLLKLYFDKDKKFKYFVIPFEWEEDGIIERVTSKYKTLGSACECLLSQSILFPSMLEKIKVKIGEQVELMDDYFIYSKIMQKCFSGPPSGQNLLRIKEHILKGQLDENLTKPLYVDLALFDSK